MGKNVSGIWGASHAARAASTRRVGAHFPNSLPPTPGGTCTAAPWRSCGPRRGLPARRAPLTHVADPCAARGLDRPPGGVLLGASIGVHLPRSPVLGHLSRHPHASRRRGVRAGRAGGSPLVTHLAHMWPTRGWREGSIACPEVGFLAPRSVCAPQGTYHCTHSNALQSCSVLITSLQSAPPDIRCRICLITFL